MTGADDGHIVAVYPGTPAEKKIKRAIQSKNQPKIIIWPNLLHRNIFCDCLLCASEYSLLCTREYSSIKTQFGTDWCSASDGPNAFSRTEKKEKSLLWCVPRSPILANSSEFMQTTRYDSNKYSSAVTVVIVSDL